LIFSVIYFHRYFLIIFDCSITFIILLCYLLKLSHNSIVISSSYWIVNHLYRSSLLFTEIVTQFYRYFIIIFDCPSTPIVLFLLIFNINLSIVIFSSYLIADLLLSFLSIVDLHCKTLLLLFSHHIWLLYHFYRSSLLLNDTVNTSITIFSSYLKAEALLSFFLNIDLHCKTFLSLFSSHIWSHNHFSRYFLMLIYAANASIVVFSLYLINEQPIKFFSIIDLRCKHFYRYFLILFYCWTIYILLIYYWVTL
jgi:hypothetical protein